MTGDSPDSSRHHRPSASKTEKDQRLSAALRANLRKRKNQQRLRETAEKSEPPEGVDRKPPSETT